MAKNTVQVIDHGWERIKREIRLADKSYTKVGFPDQATVGQASRKLKGVNVATNMTEMAMRAAFNEWGVEMIVTEKQARFLHSIGLHMQPGSIITIPARPFMSTSFDESIMLLNRLRNKLYRQVTEGRMSARQALSLIGEFMVARMKKKIREINTPPNHPVTIALKRGSTNPLVATSQMINTVTHVEVMK